jgi:hypothetical protein
LRNLAADRSFGYCWWFGLLVEYWRQIERKMKVVFFVHLMFLSITISLCNLLHNRVMLISEQQQPNNNRIFGFIYVQSGFLIAEIERG